MVLTGRMWLTSDTHKTDKMNIKKSYERKKMLGIGLSK
jgi:hypothetical protein